MKSMKHESLANVENYTLVNNKKGITLVALIVTIVILIILAGITIAQLTGENGLFARAKQAKQETENSQAKEDEILYEYENKIGEYIEGSVRDNSNEYDVLWNWETLDGEGNIKRNITNSGSIVLNNNIENYKYLIVFSRGYQAEVMGWGVQVSTIIPAKVTQTDKEYANSYYQFNNAGYNIIYGLLKNNTLDIFGHDYNWYTDCSITQVWGMK